MDLSRGGCERLDVLRGAVRGADDGLNRAGDREHERELRREQRQQFAVRRAVHRGVGVAHAPHADQPAGVVQRHQHLRARRLVAAGHDLLAAQPVRHERPARAHGFAGEPGVGVVLKAPRHAHGCRRVRHQLHLMGGRSVARQTHVLPGHQLARELLDVREAALDVDLGGDRVRQALHQVELVGPHAEPDHAQAAGRRRHQRAGDGELGTERHARRGQREPPQRQRRGRQEHHRFPSRREP